MKYMKKRGKSLTAALVCAASLCTTGALAQTLTSNSTGTNGGFYYTFWKDNGNASFQLMGGGRYKSQWNTSTNNWVGGKGWNPGGAKVVNYSGYYGVNNSQNSYLALYGWTRNPLVEYYVIESYGSYNPSSCNGGTNYGSFQTDGATYNIRRCQRVQQPSIDGTQTFYQYFSVRSPKKGFGQISGTINTGNHFRAWASKGLNLGNHNYMVLATEGYRSTGSSDISVSEGSGSSTNTGGTPAAGGDSGYTENNTPSKTPIVIRARGTAGGEHINLLIDGSPVADWTLTTTAANYAYSGNAGGDLQVEFDNDGGDRDVILDYVFVNGETRQAEDMDYNTATYGNGECGGGSNSETMHCGGVIGFGGTGNCFSGSCNGTAPAGSTSTNTGNTNTNTGTNTGTTTGSCNGYVGITFDDGPTSNTSTLINTLKQNNLTPVTWFVWGERLARNSSMASQMRSIGELQNHSYTHPHMTNLGYSQIVSELTRANQAIQATGAPKPTLYRATYGEVNSTIRSAAQSAGLRVMTWDVDSQDWNGASASSIAAAAGRLQNGQVILMHDGYSTTNSAVAQIARTLRSKGLCPGRIDPNTGRAVAPSSNSNTGSNNTGNTNTGNTNTGTTTSGDNTIIVRARGTDGSESITLSVSGRDIQTWTLGTSYRDYTAKTDYTGEIKVTYTNDGTGRDVQVDYVNVNGSTRQAEDMADNTGAYSGSCGGGSYSEMLHCNGAISFGDIYGNSTPTTPVATPTPTPTPPPANTGSSCQCNWYGSTYPICNNSTGWGWENSRSCIGTATCNSQQGNGGVVCN